MTESPGFSVLVRRLLAHRGLDAHALTGTDEPGLRTALDGSEPALDLLGHLAPVLRLLIWETRRLTDDQVRQLTDQLKSARSS
jgi:hypothetical protein